MTEDEALVKGDMMEWAEVLRERGDILPVDAGILENMWLLARMRSKYVPLLSKIQCRDILIKREVITGEPLTVMEKLTAKNYPHRVGVAVKFMLEEAEEVVLIFPDVRVRNRIFMRISEELRGTLDMVHSSVNKMELYTVQGKHIKFLTEYDDYNLPDKKTVFRVINSAI